MAIRHHGPLLGETSTESLTDPAKNPEYIIEGSNNYDDIVAYIETNFASQYPGMSLGDYQVKSIGYMLWHTSLPFKLWKAFTATTPPASGKIKISGEIGGGTQNVQRSLETIASYKHPYNTHDITDQHGLIGVDGDNVSGTDIYIPAFSFNIEYTCPNLTANQDYFRDCYNLCAFTNDDEFDVSDGQTHLTFDEGEVLFIGMTWGPRDEDNLGFNFKYLANPNKEDIDIDGITVTSKKGWEYLWTTYMKLAGTAISTVPWEVYIERVYEGGDLKSILPSE